MARIEILKEKVIIQLGNESDNVIHEALIYNKEDLSEIIVKHSKFEIKDLFKLTLNEETKIKIDFDEIWYLTKLSQNNKILTLDLRTDQYLYQRLLNKKPDE